MNAMKVWVFNSDSKNLRSMAKSQAEAAILVKTRRWTVPSERRNLRNCTRFVSNKVQAYLRVCSRGSVQTTTIKQVSEISSSQRT